MDGGNARVLDFNERRRNREDEPAYEGQALDGEHPRL